MTLPIKRWQPGCVLLAVLFHCCLVSAKTLTLEEEVFVVGDVHGAYSELTGLLQELKVVNSQNDWVAGKRFLISLGDLIDRGADSRKVVELFMKLQTQAQAAGGGVELVLGNHEVMVMTGDYRYVSKAEFAAFKDLETRAERDKLKADYEKLIEGGVAMPAAFEEMFPVGFMGLYKAYSPQGVLGSWLRKQAGGAIKLNDLLLVHGGASREFASDGLSKTNQKVVEALQAYQQPYAELVERGELPFILPGFDGTARLEGTLSRRNKGQSTRSRLIRNLAEQRNSILFSSNGPFWYRGNAQCPQVSESYTTDLVRERIDVSRILMGHTVKFRRVASRIDGNVILLDTGMLKDYYRGTPSALTIKGSELQAYHAGGQYDASFFSDPLGFKGNPQGMSDTDVENFLKNAEIIDSKRIGTGITNSRVLTLKQGDRQLRAAFKVFDNRKDLHNKKDWSSRYEGPDRYHNELAAYKLDRLLEMNLIPPTVLRTVNKEEGSVQLWIEDVITENNRVDKRLGFHGTCALSNYTLVRIVFDTLIYNVDRNNGNILWDKDFELTFIDHSQSFGSNIGKPSMYRRNPLRLSQWFRKKLQALDDAEVREAMRGLLHSHQIDRLRQRRNFILDNAEAPR